GATITIQATDNQTRTITIDPRAMIMRGNAHLTVRDVKVGDRVVLDVDRTGSVATGVELETDAAALASRAPQSQPPSAQPSQAESQPHVHMLMPAHGWQFMTNGSLS